MNRTFVLIALALAVACTRDDTPAARPARSLVKLELSDPIDSVTGVATSCEFAKTQANPDPKQLVTEFARRGADGEFLQTDAWFSEATDCPGHVQGWDAYDIIGSYAVSNASADGARGMAVVTYLRIGEVRQGAAAPVFHVDTTTIADTLTLRRTGYGWRIAGQVPPLRVSYLAAFARGDLKAADTLRIAALLAERR
jgi:hypothetical protein